MVEEAVRRLDAEILLGATSEPFRPTPSASWQARLPADTDAASAARIYAELRAIDNRLLAENTLEQWLSAGGVWRRWDRGRAIAAHLEAAGRQELADYVCNSANNSTDGC